MKWKSPLNYKVTVFKERRAGESIGLEIGDMKPDQHGAILMVDGKTGSRRIRLVESVLDLPLWLNMYPLKERGTPRHGFLAKVIKNLFLKHGFGI